VSAQAPVTAGIDLGGTKIFGALVSAGGEVTDEIYLPHEGGGGDVAGLSAEEHAGGAPYARLVETVGALLARARAAGLAVDGLGVGAPGIVRAGGVIAAGNAFEWAEFPLQALLEKRFGIRVRVENDVNLAALGEHAFGAGRGAGSMFLMAIGTGIGGAVIVDGKLWRGARAAAGEIGLFVPGRELLGWRDRQWGAFEGVASGTGIANEARAAAGAAGVSGGDEAAFRADKVFAAAAAGTTWAKAVVDRAVDLWAVGLSAVQAVLDPEVIVISGGVSGSAAAFLPAIEAKLAAAMLFPPRVVLSRLGYRAGVLGARALVG
jgi:glucokinase